MASVKAQLQETHQTELKHLNLRFKDHVRLTKSHYDEKLASLSEQLRVTTQSLHSRRQAEETQVAQLQSQVRLTEERLRAEQERNVELQFQANKAQAQPAYVEYQRLLLRLEQVEQSLKSKDRAFEEERVRQQNAIENEKLKYRQV